MIQGYFITGNLNACLKRLQNQYNIISKDVDWDDFNTDAGCKIKWDADLWPLCMGDGFGTKLEQDKETGDYLFNIMLTQEQIESLPAQDNPNFTFHYEGEEDEYGEPLPLPTFKVKRKDGSYYDRAICIQR